MNSHEQKIENILGRVRDKLKIIPLDSTQRFDQKLGELKNLSTFFDTSKQIKQVNIVNNKDLLRRVQKFLVKKKLPKNDIDNNFDQFYQELERNYESQLYDDEEVPQMLKFGELYSPTKELDIQSYLNYKKVIGKISFQHLRSLSMPDINIRQPNTTRAQFDENKFYYQLDSMIDHAKHKVYIDQINKQRQFSEYRRKQEQKDQELIETVKQYGLDLNKINKIDKQIYSAFTTKTNKLINDQLNEAKQLHKDNIKSDQQIKTNSKRFKISQILEHKIFGTPLPKIYQKRDFLSERRSLARQRTVYVNDVTAQAKHIESECQSQPQDYKELVSGLQSLETCIEEVAQRADFTDKLKTLGFSQEEYIALTKKQRESSQMQKILKKKNERALRLLKYN
ncbi:hypothetical protein pb186bvf_014126 [Paramecium bursaria]